MALRSIHVYLAQTWILHVTVIPVMLLFMDFSPDRVVDTVVLFADLELHGEDIVDV